MCKIDTTNIVVELEEDFSQLITIQFRSPHTRWWWSRRRASGKIISHKWIFTSLDHNFLTNDFNCWHEINYDDEWKFFSPLQLNAGCDDDDLSVASKRTVEFVYDFNFHADFDSLFSTLPRLAISRHHRHGVEMCVTFLALTTTALV